MKMERRVAMPATSASSFYDHTATSERDASFYNATLSYGDLFWLWDNTTTSLKGTTADDVSSTVLVVLLSVVACVTSLVTVSGNLIVVLSFALERSIRQPSNYFIASLAVSDFLIGAVSMPLHTFFLFFFFINFEQVQDLSTF